MPPIVPYSFVFRNFSYRIFAARSTVGVGMPVTQHPLHRSMHAALPHTALALGGDDQTVAGIGMAGAREGQPVVDDSVHALPTQVFGLTAAAQRAMPQPGDLEPEDLHPCAVAGHGEVARMPG